MKNIVIWSRDVDLIISKIVALSFVGMIGLCLPSPLGEGGDLGILGILVAVSAAIFSWGVFGLIKPIHWTRNWRHWQIAEFWIVPLTCGLLIAAISIWLHHQISLENSFKIEVII